MQFYKEYILYIYNIVKNKRTELWLTCTAQAKHLT